MYGVTACWHVDPSSRGSQAGQMEEIALWSTQLEVGPEVLPLPRAKGSVPVAAIRYLHALDRIFNTIITMRVFR